MASIGESRRQEGPYLPVFFFQAEDGIRDLTVTGVQTCALPIWVLSHGRGIRREPMGGADGRARRAGGVAGGMALGLPRPLARGAGDRAHERLLLAVGRAAWHGPVGAAGGRRLRRPPARLPRACAL